MTSPHKGRGRLILALVLGAMATVTFAQNRAKDNNPTMTSGLTKVAGDLQFPEGPAYDGKGSVYCSNCNADFITKVTLGGQVSVSHRANTASETPFTFHKTNGMTFYKDGSLFACDFGRNAIIRIYPDGKQEVYVDKWEGKPLEGPNDLAFDPKGNLYFTAPAGSDKEHPTGPVYRVDAKSRQITRVAEGMAFPNGLAFTADAKFLYVCETFHNRVLRFAVKSDGSLGKGEPFADLSPNGDGFPDGMAVDAKGNLWVSHYKQHSVVVFNSKGRIIRVVRLPKAQNENGPTNIEFAGKDLKTVYITDPGTEAMYSLRVDTPGLALFCSPTNTGKE